MALEQLSTTFSALSDPTRLAILSRLRQGEATLGELAEPFEMSLQAVSRHLKVLESAGLITRGRDAQRRPCRLKPQALKQIDGWLGGYRTFWEESFDKLEARLEATKGKKK
jgi:DNA-binding transcriptional ArsR family regulator